MSETIRVLVVDDHIAVAESLHALLGRQTDFELLEIAGDAASALRIADARRPHVILMDQNLPDAPGVEAARRILAAIPGTAVIMFSGGMTAGELAGAVEAGICGYLPKTSNVNAIVSAIRRAAAGEILLDPVELTQILRQGREQARRREERDRQLSALTPREREVLRLMAEAQDVQRIADRLGISLHTARGYIQNVLEKLGAHSRLEAVVRANELGLLES